MKSEFSRKFMILINHLKLVFYIYYILETKLICLYSADFSTIHLAAWLTSIINRNKSNSKRVMKAFHDKIFKINKIAHVHRSTIIKSHVIFSASIDLFPPSTSLRPSTRRCSWLIFSCISIMGEPVSHVAPPVTLSPVYSLTQPTTTFIYTKQFQTIVVVLD